LKLFSLEISGDSGFNFQELEGPMLCSVSAICEVLDEKWRIEDMSCPHFVFVRKTLAILIVSLLLNS
jgi:hypothetical protein